MLSKVNQKNVKEDLGNNFRNSKRICQGIIIPLELFCKDTAHCPSREKVNAEEYLSY